MPEATLTTQVAVVTVTEQETVVVTTTAAPQVVEIGIPGPQGPQGIQGPPGVTILSALNDVDVTSKVDKSIFYYDELSGKFKADDINTVTTLTDGGNF